MPPPPAVSDFRITAFTYRTISLAWSSYVPTTLINNFHLYVGLDPADRTNMLSMARSTTAYVVATYPFGTGVLAPGTLYYITIVGHSNANGTSPETQLSQSTVVLAAPTGFESPAQTTTSISTSWTVYPNNTWIDNLRFFINTFDPPTSGTFLNKSTTSRTVSSLTPNTRYYIHLVAEINQLDPLPDYISPPAILNTATLTPPPSNLIASLPTATTINISWTNPAVAPTNILLAISTIPGDFTNTVTLAPGTNLYQWTSLNPSTMYYFRVLNVNVLGVETAGIFTNLSTSAAAIPPLISILFTDITESGFLANFTFDTPNPTELGYKFTPFGTSPPENYTVIAVEPELAFSGLAEDTNYYLEVVAIISPDTSTPVIATVYTTNGVPTNFTPASAPTDTAITMGWDASPSPTTGYTIWRSEIDGVFTSPITIGDVQTYEFTSLSPETQYYFKLVDLGTGSPSQPTYSSALTAPAILAPPEGFVFVEATSSTVRLQWTFLFVDAWELSRSSDDDPNSYLTPLSIPGTDIEYTFTALLPNTYYNFRLKYNLNGNQSLPAYTFGSTTTAPPPPAPEGFIADIIGSTDIRLAWYAAAGAISYNIQRSSDYDPSFWLPPITLESGATSYQFEGLVPNNLYNFRLTYFIAGDVESEPALFRTSTLPIFNTPSNYILYVYTVTHGFKNSPNSPQRSIGRPVFRQIRGGR